MLVVLMKVFVYEDCTISDRKPTKIFEKWCWVRKIRGVGNYHCHTIVYTLNL